jgi:hypothetical protein
MLFMKSISKYFLGILSFMRCRFGRFALSAFALVSCLWIQPSFASSNQGQAKQAASKGTSATQQRQSIRQDFNLKLRLSSDPKAPASTRLAAKLLGQEVQLAQFQHQIEIQDRRFEIRYRLDLPGAAATVSGIEYIARSGEGNITVDGLQGQRITERRGAKGDFYEAKVEHDGKLVGIYKNQKKIKDEAISKIRTDLTSLPYFWLGKPVKPGRLRIDVIDTKKVFHEDFVGKPTNARFQGQLIKAVQFDKVKRGPDDAELTILVRESDGFPLRIDLGLSAKYGITALMFPQTIPPASLSLQHR